MFRRTLMTPTSHLLKATIMREQGAFTLKARENGDEEANLPDKDFVTALEYGMPPACGWGNSERNFWLLEGVSGREAVPFPLIKHKEI